jgi:hypothetical protein
MAVSYQLIREAILQRRCASALYGGYVRVFCPRTIGKDKRGADVVEAFQYGGGHPGGLSPGGAWCCFHVSGLDWISVNGDDWRHGADNERHRHWVVDIDLTS